MILNPTLISDAALLFVAANEKLNINGEENTNERFYENSLIKIL